MMELKFDTNNASFESGIDIECACILERIGVKLLNQQREGTILDTNGNRIGTWKLTQ